MDDAESEFMRACIASDVYVPDYSAHLPFLTDGGLDDFAEAQAFFDASGPDNWRAVNRAAKTLSQAMELKRPLSASRRALLLGRLFVLILVHDVPFFEHIKLLSSATALLAQPWRHGVRVTIAWRPLLNLLERVHLAKGRAIPPCNQVFLFFFFF